MTGARIAIAMSIGAVIFGVLVLVPVWAIPVMRVADVGVEIDCSRWQEVERSVCESAAMREVRDLDDDPEEEWWLPPVTKVIVPRNACGHWEFERGPYYTSMIEQLC